MHILTITPARLTRHRGWPHSLCEHGPGELLGPECPLVEWCLAQPREDAGNRWGADAPWVADPYFVLWLLGVAPLSRLWGALLSSPVCTKRAATSVSIPMNCRRWPVL